MTTCCHVNVTWVVASEAFFAKGAGLADILMVVFSVFVDGFYPRQSSSTNSAFVCIGTVG